MEVDANTIVDVPGSSPGGTTDGEGQTSEQATGAGDTAQNVQPEAGDRANANPLKDDKEFQGLLGRKKQLQEQAAYWEKKGNEAKRQYADFNSKISPTRPNVEVSENLQPYVPDLSKMIEAHTQPLVSEIQNLRQAQAIQEEQAWRDSQKSDIEATAAKFPDFWEHEEEMNKLLSSNPTFYDIPKERLYKMVAFDKTIEKLKGNGKVEAIKEMQQAATKSSPPPAAVSTTNAKPPKLSSLDEDVAWAVSQISK